MPPRRAPDDQLSGDDLERRALAAVERLLDLDEDARGRELATLDPDLAVAVRRLLAHDGEAHDWMPTEAPGLWPDEDSRLPERIGPFAIRGVLGRGGMGVVLRGVRDDGLFAQTVAIKLMRAGIGSPLQHERFLLERRILARLDDPSVCRILDGGVFEGRPYLIMDHVDGVPVTHWARSQDLGLKGRIALFLQVCEAVQYAHRQMIVHADLKPSNILVTPEGQVKLLDFGISRLLSEDGADAQASSGSDGSVTFTRAYAPPERRRGDRPTVQGDVFSLGAILFELLTGTVSSPSERHEPQRIWPLPSAAATLPAVPAGQLAGDLDAIVLRALASDPDRRYPDVAALVADLRAWCDHYPVRARPLGWAGRSGRFLRRHRRGLAVTAVLALLLAGAATLAALEAIRAERAREEATARFDIARGAAHRLLFDTYDRLSSHSGTVRERADIAEQSTAYLDGLMASPHPPADLRFEAGLGYRRLAAIRGLPGTPNLGQPDKATEALDRAETLFAALNRERPGDPEVLAQLGWVGVDRWLLHANDEDSIAANTRARRQFEAALARNPRYAEARLGRLATLRSAGYDLTWTRDRAADAVPLLRGALGELRRTRWPAALQARAILLEIGLLNRLGDALYYANDIPGSLAPFREADAIVDGAIAREGATPNWLILRGENAFNISGTLGDMGGHAAEAFAVARRGGAALQTLLRFGPDAAAEKKLLILYGQEAALLEDRGDIAAALVPSDASVALRTARLAKSPGDPQRMRDLAIGLIPNAELLAKAGRRKDACRSASKAADLWTEITARNRLGKLDARRNVPKANALRRTLCA